MNIKFKKSTFIISCIGIFHLGVHAQIKPINSTIQQQGVKPTVVAPNQNLSVPQNANELAVSLKSQNKTAAEASLSIKSKNYEPTECYSAMLKANYDTLSTALGVKNAYALTATTFNAAIPQKLSVLAHTINLRVRLTRHCFPGITFEQCLTAMNSRTNLIKNIFTELCKSYQLTNTQIVEKGITLHNGNALSTDGNQFGYPDPKEIYDVVKIIRPNTSHYEIFALIINKNYDIGLISSEIPLFVTTANGGFTDNVSACFITNKPPSQNLGSWSKTKMEISANPDGTYQTHTNNVSCYTMAIKKLHEQNVSIQKLEQLTDTYITCTQGTTGMCATAKTQLRNSIISSLTSK